MAAHILKQDSIANKTLDCVLSAVSDVKSAHTICITDTTMSFRWQFMLILITWLWPFVCRWTGYMMHLLKTTDFNSLLESLFQSSSDCFSSCRIWMLTEFWKMLHCFVCWKRCLEKFRSFFFLPSLRIYIWTSTSSIWKITKSEKFSISPHDMNSSQFTSNKIELDTFHMWKIIFHSKKIYTDHFFGTLLMGIKYQWLYKQWSW